MKSKTDSVSEACGTGNPSPTLQQKSNRGGKKFINQQKLITLLKQAPLAIFGR